ncbi:hypothetical protein [Devosia sp. Root635]|uniref:DUF7146 domain-containing protein n=1 Tax=Devosia sp. Root635 TaxID=1736575 RepID=UPI0006FD66D6|nr:hypothetical protein [Devosia sp. Root635]KRA44683.1 hypothetical protein ASD80_05955 [Devosia sp. Root635]
MTLSPELASLRDQAMAVTCWSWSTFRGWKLSNGVDRCGPCPKCGGKDRFAIHTQKNTFNCRKCGLSGSGVIDLVMKTEDVPFVDACEIITGRKASEPLDPERARQLDEQRRRDEQRRQSDAERYRLKAIGDAVTLWNRSVEPGPAGSGGVLDYLALRGLKPSRWLREIPVLDYVTEVMVDGRKTWPVIHSGPAMIAGVVQPDMQMQAVHVTWIDLGQAKGKVALHHPTRMDEKTGAFEPLPSRKVFGHKKGGSIRLFTPSAGLRRIVMGEGIETTWTMAVHNFEPGTAYWAGVDVPNMAGKAFRDIENKRHRDRPDLDDLECFLPPDWCEELVYLCDEAETLPEIIRGLARAVTLRDQARDANPALPLLAASYVEPIGDGKDMNELVRVQAGD